MLAAPVGLSPGIGNDSLRLVFHRLHRAVLITDDGLVIGQTGRSVFTDQADLNGLVHQIIVHGVKEKRAAILIPDHSLSGILHRHSLMPPVVKGGLHRNGRAVNEPVRQIQGMDGLIDDHPSPFLIPGPLPVRTGVIILRPVPGQRASRALHPAQPAVRDPLFHQLRGRVIPALEDHAVLEAELFRKLHRLSRVLIPDAHGLLAEHMDAPFQRLPRRRNMQIMRQAQMHRIRLFLFQKLRIIRIGLRMIFLRGRLCPLSFNIAHRRKLHPFQMSHGIQMHHRNISAADHCRSAFFHHIPFLFPPPTGGIS